jgi:hypothetical protein
MADAIVIGAGPNGLVSEHPLVSPDSQADYALDRGRLLSRRGAR